MIKEVFKDLKLILQQYRASANKAKLAKSFDKLMEIAESLYIELKGKEKQK